MDKTKLEIANIPIIAARGAGLDSGIQLAEDYNLTLLGLVRNGEILFYKHENRIIL